MITIDSVHIETIGVVDDDPEVRRAYEFTLEDADLRPIEEKGPLGSLSSYVDRVSGRLDAVLCDHHLTVRNYATFDGAELAATLYSLSIPTVLCTRWESAQLDAIRPYRDRVPALIHSDDLEPESLVDALTTVVRELDGTYTEQRRPWRTQVHIADVGTGEFNQFFFIDLPGWTTDEVIRVRKSDLPAEMIGSLAVDARWHALVNIGADQSHELYFRGWEPE